MIIECNDPECVGLRVNMKIDTPHASKFFRSKVTMPNGTYFYFGRCTRHSKVNSDTTVEVTFEECIIAGVMET